MCCFSQPVISVSATNIFARPAADERQFIVYSMSIEANNELAMILPLPIKTPAGEEDVRFVNLKGYPDFFSVLLSGFPVKPPLRDLLRNSSVIPSASSPLKVQQVGDFEA